jgi:hypothetical protein
MNHIRLSHHQSRWALKFERDVEALIGGTFSDS